jgi:hypothetical protein
MLGVIITLSIAGTILSLAGLAFWFVCVTIGDWSNHED